MLRLITAPTADVVTLAEARAQCRVDADNTDEDVLLQRFINSAVARFDGRDGILGMALRPQTWDLVVERFPLSDRGRIALPLPPTISVTSVTYLDELEAVQTLSALLYRVVNGGDAGAQIVLVTGNTWPATAIAPDAVRVRFQCGHVPSGTPDIPEAIRQAILLIVGEWYSNRSNAVVGTTAAELPTAAADLIAPHRQIFEPEPV